MRETYFRSVLLMLIPVGLVLGMLVARPPRPSASAGAGPGGEKTVAGNAVNSAGVQAEPSLALPVAPVATPPQATYRGSFAGHVIDAHQTPVPGLPVEVFRIAEAPLDGRELKDMLPLRAWESWKTTTDALGGFRFDDLPAGHYSIRAETDAQLATDDMPMRVVGPNDGPNTFVGTSAAKRMDLTPALIPAAPLSGQVLLPDGRSAPLAEIFPYRQESGAPELSPAESYMQGQKCNDDGRFRFPKLKNGLWQFAVSMNGGPLALSDWIETGTGDVVVRLGGGERPADHDIVARTLNGEPFRLSALRGKFVLLDFWATWCGPCRAETPNLKAVYERFKDNPKVAMVGLSLDGDPELAKRYVLENGMGWTQVGLGDWNKATPAKVYRVDGIPQIILLGPDGNELRRDLRGQEIADVLATYLSQTEPISSSNPAQTPMTKQDWERKLMSTGRWIANPATGHEYGLTKAMRWDRAQEAALQLGGDLVTVNDAAENVWLTQTFDPKTCYWIGFTDAASEGNYVWASGEPVTFRGWAEGEPNNGDARGVQNWAIINWLRPGWWDDQYVDRTYQGIVERPAGGLAPPEQEGSGQQHPQ